MRASIYPVPDPELPFLGAHLTRGPDGSVLLGPTALIAGARDAYRPTRIAAADLRETLAWPGTWRLVRRYWRAGLTEVTHLVSKRALVARGAAPGPRAARRATSSPARPGSAPRPWAATARCVDDFLVSRSERGAVRPQRALARGDLVAAARAPGRRRGRAAARLSGPFLDSRP